MDDAERDFEREVRQMLNARVAGLPDAYEASAGLVRRARRHHGTRLAAVVATVVVVAAGTTSAVAQVLTHQSSRRLAVSAADSARTTVPATRIPAPPAPTTRVTATTAGPAPTQPTVSTAPGTHAVATVACPIANARRQKFAPPSTAPRTPLGGYPAALSDLESFAATTDPSYVVLGPKAWSCQASAYADGRSSVVVFDPTLRSAVPAEAEAPVAVDIDWLWHGGVGSVTACSVFDDPTVARYVTRNFPTSLPCRPAGRRVTSIIDSHMSEFVDADGARGAGWMVLPSAQGGDGFITVLTCRPTAGLTTADCGAIVADFVARMIDRT